MSDWQPTEQEIEAALTVYQGDEQMCPHADESWLVLECDCCLVVRIVSAVGPLIAARALTEAADAVADLQHSPTRSPWWTDAIDHAEGVLRSRARAEAVTSDE